MTAPAELAAPSTMLTETNMTIMRMVADGHTNAEIGRELHYSEWTIHDRLRAIYLQLGVRSRAHAVAALFRAGQLT